MSAGPAAELRRRGKAAFVAKRYEEAVRHYTAAMEMEKNSIDLYNNRSAAYHGLKRYEDAINDAKRSLAIADNARGHSRLAEALWSTGQWEMAKREYEHALTLAPDDVNIQANLVSLRATIAGKAPQPGTAAVLPCAADAMTVVVGFAYVVSTVIAASWVFTLWNILLASMMLRQALTLYENRMFSLSKSVMDKWIIGFAPLFFVLCGIGLVAGVAPQLFFGFSVTMYCATDLVDNIKVVETSFPKAYHALSPYIERVLAQRSTMILYAASCEAMTLFSVILTGGSIFTLVYIQFIKLRYQTDTLLQMAFTALRMNISKLTQHRMAPLVVDRMFQKACDLMYSLSQSKY